jgi:photosystem II stability/assembly factor-like uncharacterized protein
MKTLLCTLVLLLGFAHSSKATPEDSTHWTRVPTLNTRLHGLAYVSGDTIYCKGAKMYRTFDAGATWDSLPIPFYGDISFRDAATGLLLGASQIYKTTDSGQTWAPHDAGTNRLLRIRWVGHDSAFVSADGGVSRSTDAGETWNEYPGVVKGSHISFINSKVGAVCGDRYYFPGHPQDEPKTGSVAITANGGTLWTQVYTGVQRNFTCVKFLSSQVILAAAEGGMICRTTDRGMTWDTSVVLLRPNEIFEDGWFINDHDGILAGSAGVVCLTHNGGISWETERVPSSTFYGVQMVNDTLAYAVSEDGLFRRFASVLAVQPITANLGVTVSPNPTSGAVTFSFPSVETLPIEISLYNTEGVQMAHAVRGAGGPRSIEFSLSARPSGTYVYVIAAGGYAKTGKITLAH